MALDNNRLTASLDFADHQAKNIGLPLSVGKISIDDIDGGRIISSAGGNSFLIRSNNAASEASPTYSFLNNPDTGMWSDSGGGLGLSVNGTARVVLEAAREVSVEGNRITNVASPDNASDVATKGYVDGLGFERVLGRNRILLVENGTLRKMEGDSTALYTVPVGKSHIITKIIMRSLRYSVSGSNAHDPVLSIGVNGSDYDDINKGFPVSFGGSSSAADRATILLPDQAAVTPNTGSVVKASLVNVSTSFINLEVEIMVMGVEI